MAARSGSRRKRLPGEQPVKNALNAALAYAVRGWAVLAIHSVIDSKCYCGRSDCSHPGKHPCTLRGVHDATTEPQVIRDLWRRWPAANIGIAMGKKSGLLAVDVDARNEGHENL